MSDPMDELVAVSEEAGLYDDPCPDCEHFPKFPCPTCGGSGKDPSKHTNGTSDPCPDCERGKVRRGFFDVPCPSCGGSVTRPADTRSVERRHVDAAVDRLAAEGVPMLDRDRLARAALDAAWRKAPWDMPGTRPAVTDAEVEAALDAYEGYLNSNGPKTQHEAMRIALEAAARARQENRDG